MPLSPEARRALEALNRGPLKHTATPPDTTPAAPETGAAAAPAPGGAARRAGALGTTAPGPIRMAPASEPPLVSGEPPALERLVPGRAAECGGRACFLHERPVHTPSWREVPIARQLLSRLAVPPSDPEHPLAPLMGGSPEDVLFLDVETAGLSGGPLFLVGVLFLRDEDLVLQQYFARDYTEEPGVLAHARALLLARPTLVTFNGKTFDLPYIANRSAYHRLPLPTSQRHVDLLHLARRRWRGRLPDCRLQTLERHVCRRHRVDDIPGELMAQAYHDFVRTGDATQMRKVFHHNLMDLVTMVEVLCALAG